MADPQGFEQRNRTSRTVFRIVGLLLLLVGAYFVVIGATQFADDAASPDVVGPGFGPILRMGLGGFLVVFGVAALGMGFLGAQSRYAAGETMPVVKESAEYLSDGEGVLGIGRSAGPSCPKCGTRNDRDARFCDRCGSPVVV